MMGRVFAVAAIAFVAAAAPSLARAAEPVAWCGTGAPAQTDRLPDLQSGQLVQVVYAHPAGGEDRFSTMASAIATDWAIADAWWRRQDPTRTIRLDLFSFAGCATKVGDLDIADVALPHDADFYYSLANRFDRLLTDLIGAPFSFRNPYKKYVVYYDAQVEETRICGQGGTSGGGLPDYGFIFVQTCGQQIGDGKTAAITAVHELVHALGAVPFGAPHMCRAPNYGHVCEAGNDLMYPFNSAQLLDNEVLDVGRDDYYGHNGAWFDVQDSPWLAHLDAPQFEAHVAFGGSGRGSVASDVPGIACSAPCSAIWDAGSALTLSATPAVGSRFVGWSGACTGTEACSLAMDGAKSVTAQFVAASRVLRLAESGRGRITSTPAGIACPGRCDASFPEGSTVTLREVATKGYRFTGWSGACKGTAATCRVKMRANMSVRAVFKKV